MLTPPEAKALKYIEGFITKKGYGPTYDEMRRGLRMASKNTIWRVVHGLKQKGFIEALPYRARAIEVVRKHDDYKKGVKA